jgi:hypothetical protein
VEFEATYRAKDFIDGARIKEFLHKHAGRVEVIPTTVGSYALPDLRRKMDAGEPVTMPRDLGELSITSFVISLRTENPGDPMLVLIEDDWFIANTYAMPGNVHLLSTAAFLDGLEKERLLPSAAALRMKIQQQRPNFRGDWSIDRPAAKIEQGTEWRSRFPS